MITRKEWSNRLCHLRQILLPVQRGPLSASVPCCYNCFLHTWHLDAGLSSIRLLFPERQVFNSLCFMGYLLGEKGTAKRVEGRREWNVSPFILLRPCQSAVEHTVKTCCVDRGCDFQWDARARFWPRTPETDSQCVLTEMWSWSLGQKPSW